ncbi:DNA-3-methyladenine glycosylase 2 family protein [Patescibacteria group bacterium]|nr:DNA-3-methyladenine glycosylase 2 family protein [Patescibacteria group bacterium]
MTRKTAALRHLRRVDHNFFRITTPYHALLPAQLPQKRTRTALFVSLVSIVISQQLSTAAAGTVFARVKTSCKGRLTPLSILKIRFRTLRNAGLSSAKTKTLKAIARAIKNGSLDLLALKNIPETEAALSLMSIRGLGPWSVEMFMIFALGRTDVFSAGDLGLMRAIESLYGLPKNSPRETLLAIAEKWTPYRTYACLLLWRVRDTKAG